MVDNAIVKRLNISITKPWGEIKDRYNAEWRITVCTLWEQGIVYANFVIREVVIVLVLVLVLVPQMQVKLNMLVVVLVLQMQMKMNMLVVVLVLLVVLLMVMVQVLQV